MPFLIGLAAQILEWLIAKGFILIANKVKQADANKEISTKAKASVDPLKKAQDGKAIDESANSALDGF